MIRASAGQGYSQGRRGVSVHLGGPPKFGNRAPRRIRSQAHKKTPPLRRGFPPVFLWSGHLGGQRDVSRQPDRVKSFPRIKPSPPIRQLVAHRKACAQCNVGVKPSRRITKAHRRLSGAASPGPAAARENCPDSSILDSPFEELRLSRPVVRGVNYRRRHPNWSPPKPLTSEQKANLWRLEQARQLLRWWVIESRHGFLYA